jgi:metallo-beta-lactamase family protein
VLRPELTTSKTPAIVIASSGMCEAGRVLHHLAATVANPDNAVLIVGFMAQNTLGRRILERQPEVKIFNEVYPLKAEVVHLNTFSAHADYNDILAYVGQLDFHRLKAIYLVHGEPDAQTKLCELLAAKRYRPTIMKAGQVYPLLTD